MYCVPRNNKLIIFLIFLLTLGIIGLSHQCYWVKLALRYMLVLFTLYSGFTSKFSDPIRVSIKISVFVITFCESKGVQYQVNAWIFYYFSVIVIRTSIFSSVHFLSHFLEVHRLMMAQLIRFKVGTMLTYGVNSRSTQKFLWSEQSIDQDIEFLFYAYHAFEVFFLRVIFLLQFVAGAQLFHQKNLSWKSYH